MRIKHEIKNIVKGFLENNLRKLQQYKHQITTNNIDKAALY